MISAKELPNPILQNSSEKQLTLPVEMLYMKGVISGEIFDEVQRSNISPLRALFGTVSDNPNQQYNNINKERDLLKCRVVGSCPMWS